MESEPLPDVQIAVVHAAGNIRSSVRCKLCGQIPEDGHAVLRIRDHSRQHGSGVPEYVMHKTCVQALLDASTDDIEVALSRFEAYRSDLVERYAAN